MYIAYQNGTQETKHRAQKEKTLWLVRCFQLGLQNTLASKLYNWIHEQLNTYQSM